MFKNDNNTCNFYAVNQQVCDNCLQLSLSSSALVKCCLSPYNAIIFLLMVCLSFLPQFPTAFHYVSTHTSFLWSFLPYSPHYIGYRTSLTLSFRK